MSVLFSGYTTSSSFSSSLHSPAKIQFNTTPTQFKVAILIAIPVNREEKSLRHDAIIAKFLDDNKSKMSLQKYIRTVSNFISIIPFHLI